MVAKGHRLKGSSELTQVSVPLRGNGCESIQAEQTLRHFLRVSVPLRGNGCER